MSRTLILTSPHTRGPDVERLQGLLAKHGWYGGPLNGEYGPYTAQAAYRAKFWLGYPVSDLNQHAGPVLLAFLTGEQHPTPAMVHRVHRRRKTQPVGLSLGQRMLEVETAQVGYRESPPGSNDTKFGRWYGVNGQPWCAIFQSWAAAQVGLPFKYSYVPFVVADARAGHHLLTVVPNAHVRPGDLVCYDWPGESPGVADHIGCFERWEDEKAGTFVAIEGNTSEGNDSNGGEVMRRNRSTSTVQSFVRIGGS